MPRSQGRPRTRGDLSPRRMLSKTAPRSGWGLGGPLTCRGATLRPGRVPSSSKTLMMQVRIHMKIVLHFHQRLSRGRRRADADPLRAWREMRPMFQVSRKNCRRKQRSALPPSLQFRPPQLLAYSPLDPDAQSPDCQPLLNPRFIFPEPRKPDLRPWLPVFTTPWFKFDNPIDNNLVTLPHLQPNLRAEPRKVVFP
jgi:hypothetical protein